MGLGLLAVEGHRHVAAAGGQRDRKRGCQRDTLVGRPEQHVEAQAGGVEGIGITLAQHFERGAGVEQPGIEEIGTGAAGLEGELAKTQDLPVQRQVQEAALVRFHGATWWGKARLCNSRRAAGTRAGAGLG